MRDLYTLTVRSHIMIAHSFQGEMFGPAQQLHGATFLVDAEFRSTTLTAEGVVVDIGWASERLDNVLRPLNYQNLDSLPQFKDQNTSTEFLARYIHDRLLEEVKSCFMGSLKITLHESDRAWASYTRTTEG